MVEYKRNLVLDIFDYARHKICGLYDSSRDLSGQAAEITVVSERNGWKELSFVLPSVCETENGPESNYRLDYLKADYLIRQIDDAGVDWFIISEPKVVHQNFSKNVSVTAGHISQLLKTKNLGQEFSDTEGNNVGTARELLTTILQGTGWNVGQVDIFYEKDKVTEKKRSLQASAKTGAFKLITQMCGLFDAKPVFHGDSKTVDIIPMNPFSEPIDGGPPDVEQAGGVLEQHYGHNVSNITRILNTENLVTKLYAYGAYGDKTSGYCGIDECTHNEYIYTTTSDLAANLPYTLALEGYFSISFTPTADIPAGTKLIWSDLDPVSMMYIWDDTNQLAYYVHGNSRDEDYYVTNYVDGGFDILVDGNAYAISSRTLLPVTTSAVNKDGSLIVCYLDSDNDMLVDEDNGALSSKEHIYATVEIIEVQNWFSHLMDFSYYYNVGLLTDEMLQALANYQRSGAKLYEQSYDAMTDYLNAQNRLTEIVGNVKFCKLNVESVSEQDGYAKINLDTNSVKYRTDYTAKDRDYFNWTPALQINEHGDPVNDVASVLYIIHDTHPVTWEKVCIKSFNNGLTDSQDGLEQKNVYSIQLWRTLDSLRLGDNDSFYLFELNNVNALLGSWEAADEAKSQALSESTKVVTSQHPVYFYDNEQPKLDTSSVSGYAWAWKYDPSGITPSQMYFYFGDGSSECYATDWTRVYYSPTEPKPTSNRAYWFNWGELENWNTATLYAYVDGVWAEATNDIIASNWKVDGTGNLPSIPYDVKDVWEYFGTVYNACVERDRLYRGYKNFQTYSVTDSALSPGNYYFTDEYGDYYVFSTNELLTIGSTLTRDAFNGWIVQTDPTGVTTTLELKKKSFDAVRYDTTDPSILIIEKEQYLPLQPTANTGDIRGIIEFIAQFKALSDKAYDSKLSAYLAAQKNIADLEADTLAILGDLHREGWWQSSNYVDGDEDKLYDDALENLKKIAQPEATYTITFLDRYRANQGMEYAASDIVMKDGYPDIDISYVAHLIDPEIKVNVWAYIDRLAKCYDLPWKTNLSINTNLTTMAQHSFADVLTNIANVANELKGKEAVYKRAEAFTVDGMLAADRLQGAIDASKQKIFGGNSTWYTDDAGNLMFVAADGMSAMTLTGNGLAIADGKNKLGEWNWRTFGTGKGFTADEITAGFLSSDRIQANSISSYKLDGDTQDLLQWVEGSQIRLSPGSITATVTEIVPNAVTAEMNNENSEMRQSVIEQTSASIKFEFIDGIYDNISGQNDEVETQNGDIAKMNTWFDFSGDGLKIGATSADGSNSPFYTVQTNTEYAFYKNQDKLASFTGDGMYVLKGQITLGDSDSSNRLTSEGILSLSNGNIELNGKTNTVTVGNGKGVVNIGTDGSGSVNIGTDGKGTINLAAYQVASTQNDVSYDTEFSTNVTLDNSKTTKSTFEYQNYKNDGTLTDDSFSITTTYTTATTTAGTSPSIDNGKLLQILYQNRGIGILADTESDQMILSPSASSGHLMGWSLISSKNVAATNVNASAVVADNVLLSKPDGNLVAVADQNWTIDKIKEFLQDENVLPSLKQAESSQILKADKSELKLYADQITANAKDIAFNASNITTNAENIATNTTNIATNATNITAHADSIAAHADSIDAHAKSIVLNAGNIKLNADNIKFNTDSIVELNDLVAKSVTADQLNAAQADVVRMTGGTLVVDTANITTLQAESIQGLSSISGDSAWFDNLYAGDNLVATQEWVKAQGFLTSIPSGGLDGYVTAADVINYCEPIYATKTELSDYLKSSSISKTSQYVITSVTPTMNSAGYVTKVESAGTTIYYYT